MTAEKGTGKGSGLGPRHSTEEDSLEALRRLVEHLQELNRWQNNLLAEAMHRLTGLNICPKTSRPLKKAPPSQKTKP